MMHYSTMATPAGAFTVVVDDDGAVLASGFTTEVAFLIPLIHRTLVTDARPEANLGEITTAVTSYLEGDVQAIDDVPVRQHIGGTFIRHAWEVMRDIKPGSPLTYTGFAELAGRPAAIRGAAAACARNAAALFVPCHRVLRLDGSLGGYRWGLPVKRWLLDHEEEANSMSPAR